jgi:hypothetical protein
VTPEPQILSLIHSTHPAAAQFFQNSIVRNGLAKDRIASLSKFVPGDRLCCVFYGSTFQKATGALVRGEQRSDLLLQSGSGIAFLLRTTVLMGDLFDWLRRKFRPHCDCSLSDVSAISEANGKTVPVGLDFRGSLSI